MGNEFNEYNVLVVGDGGSAGGGSAGSASPPGAGSPSNGRIFAADTVAHAAAMAVSDASGYLRALSAISTAGLAACTQRYLETKDDAYGTIMGKLNDNMMTAADTFNTIGQHAASVLKRFSTTD